MFAPVPWEERLPAVERMRKEFESIFSRFFGVAPEEREPLWETAVKELEKEFLVRMEVPGFEVENFTLEMLPNRLHVKAEREAKEEGKEPAWHRFYERYVTLPAEVAPEKAVASYKNGVLEVHLPKSEEAMPHRIPVT
jgi:HSP20 family protein